ncbi:MAG: ABC transporter permease [Clostridia bacterium]|nr:ABC transporter permease [Clostridia bacterium]
MRRREASLAPWLVILLIAVVTAAIEPRFLQPGNLVNVLRHSAVLAVAAFAQTLVVVAGEIDLAAGSLVALVSMVSVLAAKASGTLAGYAAGVLTGAAAGAVNGLLVGRFQVSSFIATVAMMSYAYGLAAYIGGGVPVEFPPDTFGWLGAGYLGPVPVPVVAALGAFAFAYVLLHRAALGRKLLLIGGNRRAAQLSGVDVARSVFWGFVVAGALVGFAGVMLASKVHSGQPNLYPTLAFEAVGAVAIGGIPLTGGSGRLVQSLAGALIMGTLENALTVLNFTSQVQQMVMGAVIVFAVAANVALSRGLRRPAEARPGALGT